MADASYDVVIAGGAVIGGATAYFLSRHPAFTGRVAVIEPDPTYAECATARSVASVRQQFTTEINVLISRFGHEFFSNATAWLGEDADIGFRDGAYLLTADDDAAAALARAAEFQQGLGVRVAFEPADDLVRRFPWLDPAAFAAGCLGLAGEGWLDPYSLLQAFKRQARAAGVDYIEAAVTDMEVENGRVAAARLSDGRRLACGEFVNATGIRGARVAAMAGIELPVEPRKRCVFAFDCRERERITDCPLTVTPEGVYFRREGSYFICGVSPPADRDPATDDFHIEYWQFEEIVWPSLAKLVPTFEAIKQVNAWAGHYDFNTLDQNAVLGRHPDIANFLFASGFSGHGLQQAPAVGRGLAELIADGGYRTLDLSPLGYERIPENRPLKEGNVI